jgi:hypothetical protein
MLAYGMAFDALDKYVYIGKNTIVESLEMFLSNDKEMYLV